MKTALNVIAGAAALAAAIFLGVSILRSADSAPADLRLRR